jgi:hypothetical protein
MNNDFSNNDFDGRDDKEFQKSFGNRDDRDFKSEYSEDSLSDINDLTNDGNGKSKKVMFLAILFAVFIIIAFVVYSTFLSGEEKSEDTAMEFLDESEPFFIDSPADSLEPESGNSGFEEPEDESFSKDELIEESYSEPTYLQPVDEVPEIVEKKETPTLDKRSDISSEPPVEKVTKIETPKHSQDLIDNKKYYIQTGTFLKLQPNKKYLERILSLGVQYHIDTYVSNNREITRVLVGPFDNYNSAKDMLPTVKEKIENSSFLIKTKLH